MHPDTLAALERLAVVLVSHPEDSEALEIYGRLPMHLADAIEDHASVHEQDLSVSASGIAITAKEHQSATGAQGC